MNDWIGPIGPANKHPININANFLYTPEDIDECNRLPIGAQNGCAAKGLPCVNVPGSYFCLCDKGFRWLNNSCVGKSEIILLLVNKSHYAIS